MSTRDFVARYVRNEITEMLDTIEWLGEYRLAQSVQDEIDALKALHYGD